MKHRKIAGLFAACVSLSAATFALADADAAKKYLAQAQTDVTNNDTGSATTNLQLAEAELDGIPDDAKAAIVADIKTLRAKMTESAGSEASRVAKKYMDEQMDVAKKSLDAPQTFEETDQGIQEYLGKDENKTALGDETVAQYLKTLSTYRKVERIKAAAATVAAAKDQLDYAEKEWPEKKKSLQEAEGDLDNHPDAVTFYHHLDDIEKLVKNLPASNSETASIVSRYKKLQADFNGVLFKSKAADTYRRVKEGWEGYAYEYDGWDKETTGPTFEYLLSHQGDDADKLNAPKTAALISRADYELENWMKDDVVHTLSQSDEKVKGAVDKVRADRKTAMERLAKFAADVIDEAEKANIDQNARDRLDRLANSDLPNAIAGSDQLKPLQDRAMKLVRAFDAKTGGDAAAHQKLYDDLVAAGAKAWPVMSAKVEASDEFDANAVFNNVDNFKGKAFRFKGVSNRMGWDFSPGNGFGFAMTVDGTPVAGKYDTTVKAAIADITKRTAHDLPEESYDVIAVVTDVGPIVRIARASGDVKTTGGETVGTVTSQADETVQGVRFKIVALHVGAVTVAEDQGMVNADGSLGQPAQ